MVGFPHSEIPGSKLIRSCPRLIAAYYVLHRLHTPRHPLDALKTLDRSHYQCPQYQRSPPLLYGQDLHHRADVLLPTHHCIGLIGQIKKTRIHVRTLFLPEGVGSNRQCRISLRCPNIRSWTPRGFNTTKLALLRRSIGNSPPSLPGIGGARRDRTDDILLAKQALSQLSYGPIRDASQIGRTGGPG